MANARPGYKRIMGEIPEEIHEKITLYNQISFRQLNVSMAIERCIQQAVKKIEKELIDEAAEEAGECALMSDEYYMTVQRGIEADLSPKEIHAHVIDMLKRDVERIPKGNPSRDTGIRVMLYPVDEIKRGKTDHFIFYAKGVACFGIGHTLPGQDAKDMLYRADAYTFIEDKE